MLLYLKIEFSWVEYFRDKSTWIE